VLKSLAEMPKYQKGEARL